MAKWSAQTGDKMWDERAKYQSKDFVIYQKNGEIATITLNKPEKLNAINLIGGGPELDAFLGAITDAEQDDDIKVIIFKGAGRSFCSGQDVNMLVTVYWGGPAKCTPTAPKPNQRTLMKLDRIGYDAIGRIAYCSKVTIGQVHGQCLGVGCYLTEPMDIVIATEDAQFAHTEQRWGPAGLPVSSTPWLVHHVGLRKALDIMLTGRFMSGKEAADIGWVTKAVPSEQLEAEVKRWAEMICLYPGDGIAVAKASRHMMYESMGMNSAMLGLYAYHPLLVNMRYKHEEFNWLRDKSKIALKGINKKRDDRFQELGF